MASIQPAGPATTRPGSVTFGLIGFLFLLELTSGILQGYYIPLIPTLIKYLAQSAPDQVTGKSRTNAVERYATELNRLGTVAHIEMPWDLRLWARQIPARQKVNPTHQATTTNTFSVDRPSQRPLRSPSPIVPGSSPRVPTCRRRATATA